MIYCCVPNCTSNAAKKDTKINFHIFPKDPSLREKWRVAISLQGSRKGSLWAPNDSSRICSLHFVESDYSVSTVRRILLPNKVPTVFNNFPDHKKKILKRRKDPVVRACSSPIKQKKIDCRPVDADDQHPSIELENVLNSDVGTQTPSVFDYKDKHKNIKRKFVLKCKSNCRLRKTVVKLRSEIKKLKSNKKQKSPLEEKIQKIQKDGENGVIKALFLIEQIEAYSKAHITYGETTLKICTLWHRKAPTGYRFIRSVNCLKIPHPKTLKRYIGFSNGETGVTSLIKERLQHEYSNLECPEEKLGSLVIDEMAIKPRVGYDRKMDQFLGFSENEIEDLGRGEAVANRLLCFLFRGLSTNIRIPVVFYFTRQLTGSQLLTLTMKVISEVEETGFLILRLVTDNCSVNSNMMKELCEGPILPEIKHPNDESRPLFLSFDSSHVLKNIRSQFLAKDLRYRETLISSEHVKRLYNMQKKSIVKPVRCLTRKVVYPSNLEKMNVKRAKYLFSLNVTAALKTLPIVAPESVSDHVSLRETIKFLEYVRKWHDIHDVCNIKQSYHSRNTDKKIFTELTDDRFLWLTEEFLPYVDTIQKSGQKLNTFSQETYEALMITTHSTVKCIKYLLSNGFHYILSSNLSSDDIELLFSHLRRNGGLNDMMDARSCLYALETTLKCGMINPSDTSNVESQKFRLMDTIRRRTASDISTSVVIPGSVLELLDVPIREEPVSMELSALAMVGGYLVRVAEEKTDCGSCLEQLSSCVTDSPLMCLIRAQDRGALRYPSCKFVFFLKNVLIFTTRALGYLGKSNLFQKLKFLTAPKFKETFHCRECDQSHITDVILTKFFRPVLDNYAMKVTNDCDLLNKFNSKPLEQKSVEIIVIGKNRENIEHVPEVIALKEEVKSELSDPGSTQENSLELSEGIKEEIFIEEHADDQLLPYIKEETKWRTEVSNADNQRPDGGATCFRCNVCGEFLAEKLSLLRHLKVHKGDHPFKCDYCGKIFGSRSTLSEHLKVHRLLVCEFCHKCFNKRNRLKEHIRFHTSRIGTDCSICGKNFGRRGNLTGHMRTHTGDKPYSCNICGKLFTYKGSLSVHMRTHTGEKPYSCTTCGKSFRQAFHLTLHLRSHVHEKPFCCNSCGKLFSDKTTLSKHTWTHRSEKKYSCNVCGKYFRLRSDLIVHVRTHTYEKPYCCNICGKLFDYKINLSKHMPTHTGLKRYCCNICGKLFTHQSSLPKHIRTHTGEKPYGCKVCSKSFCQKVSLLRHVRMHSRENICNICGKVFTDKRSLSNHMRTHTGDKL